MGRYSSGHPVRSPGRHTALRWSTRVSGLPGTGGRVVRWLLSWPIERRESLVRVPELELTAVAQPMVRFDGAAGNRVSRQVSLTGSPRFCAGRRRDRFTTKRAAPPACARAAQHTGQRAPWRHRPDDEFIRSNLKAGPARGRRRPEPDGLRRPPSRATPAGSAIRSNYQDSAGQVRPTRTWMLACSTGRSAVTSHWLGGRSTPNRPAENASNGDPPRNPIASAHLTITGRRAP
jgi:hypothetical protein